MPKNFARIQIWPLRAPLPSPIKTSFGEMTSRPALLLSITDPEGRQGWGEAWVNFPQWALEVNTTVLCHLARYLGEFEGHPDVVTEAIYRKTYTQLVQSAQLGPGYQALSAINMALWDLYSQQTEAAIDSTMPVYASGIGPDHIRERIEEAMQQGFTYAKIKVGFNTDRDHQNFITAESIIGRDHVMVDANQGWTREVAAQEVQWFANHGAQWIEEPLPALDLEGYHGLAPWAHKIATGENWLVEYFPERVVAPRIEIFQPDLAKIGGYWGATRLIDRLKTRTNSVAFHVLGSPINHGAALYGSRRIHSPVSWVEIDTNENPFNACMTVPWTISQGFAHTKGSRGLGIIVDEQRLGQYVVPGLVQFASPLGKSR